MVILTWIASALGLVFLRQFFHDVRLRSRLLWGAAVLACAGTVALAVTDIPDYVRVPLLYKIVVIGGALSVMWFIWRYSRMERWWKHAVGGTIVIKDGIILALLLLTVLGLYGVGMSPWVGLGLLAGVPPVMLWRTEVWQRIHDVSGDPPQDGVGTPAAKHR